MKKEIFIGFSPCPNDTFIFDAMVNGKIDTEGYSFLFETHDVETLNLQAKQVKFDLIKLSFFAFPAVAEKYQLLDSGSALGSNCGPLLISKSKFPFSEISDLKIAIPGIHTTANFLLSFAFPDAKNKTEYVFSGIEDAVISGKCDAGVIIHENRFTYMQKGLQKLMDLGEYWESQTGHPIPLGGIAVKRELPEETRHALNRIMQRSVAFALENPESSENFVRTFAQEMNDNVVKQHIQLYVNDYTLNLSEKGRSAIEFMFSYAFKQGLIVEIPREIFLF